MKKINLIILLLLSFTSFSQNNLDYKKVGDTIFYDNHFGHVNKVDAIYFAKLKNIEIINTQKMYLLDLYLLDSINNKISIKKSTTKTNRLEIISFDGITTNYHKNETLKSQGMMKKGRPLGKWSYWYDTETKKMERFFFERSALEKIRPSKILNYWKSDGTQTVVDGNGVYNFTTEKDSTLHKGNVKNGEKDGNWIGRYKNGEKYYDENYAEGKLAFGESWDKEGNNYKYKKEFIKAEFKGGETKIRKIIQRNFKIPKTALDNNIDGTILIRFYINVDGTIANVKAFRKVMPEADEEAIRVVKLMKGWKPAVRKGKKVRTRFAIPITYKID